MSAGVKRQEEESSHMLGIRRLRSYFYLASCAFVNATSPYILCESVLFFMKWKQCEVPCSCLVGVRTEKKDDVTMGYKQLAESSSP